MKVEKYSKQKDAVVIETDEGRIKIKLYASNIIRIVYSKEQEFSSRESLMRVAQEEGFSKWEVLEFGNKLSISTEEIRLDIDLYTCALTYMDSKGEVIVKEPKRGGKTLKQIDVMKSVFDEADYKNGYTSTDGIDYRIRKCDQRIDRKAYSFKLEFEWDKNEALYGLGMHEEGIMNLRGHQQHLYQHNFKVCVPMIVSTKGYGILVDSYSLMTFHDDIYGSYIWSETNDELDYYYIFGPELDKVVGGYRHLTGKAPLLPRWAYGYVQSKERYKTQEELISVVREYRERKIPLDLLVLDWRSWSGEQWGQKSFDPERFPDPGAMMKELHKMNVKLMLSVWPFMKNFGQNQKEMQENGFLLGDNSTYDAFNTKARELYWKQANEGIFSYGIDAWWCDCTEPYDVDGEGRLKPEPEERFALNSFVMKKYMDPQYINAFSLVHSQGIYEGQRKTTSEKRVVNLTRSAYAGQQRYATITWSGDISAKWETLKRQIPSGLNFSITGIPYWTLDIGAFFTGREGEGWPDSWHVDGDFGSGSGDLGYYELYVRWFQYAVFLPMFRSHGTQMPREIWRFGEPGSIFYDTLVEFDNLRYRLIPYIYSIAGWTTLFDYTILRALVFDFRKDDKVYNISDQYMFGPAFMVCPITEPMYYNAESKPIVGVEKTRVVYLPNGCSWHNFWTGEVYKGGETIKVEATLEIMPIFVRAGAIVPMGPEVQYTDEKLDAPLELRIYTGADGSYKLYEDEGDNYNYEAGAYSLISMKWEDDSKTLTLEKREGHYNTMTEAREFRVVIVSPGHGVGTGQEPPDRTIRYNGQKTVISFNEYNGDRIIQDH